MATNTYQLSINTNCSGQFASNILHFQFDDGGFSTAELAAMALINSWATAAQAPYLLMVPASTTLLSYKARRVTGGGGFEAFLPVAGGTVGSRTGLATSSGISPVIIFYPVANGKQRGRMFLPGLSISDASGGILSSSLRNAINANAPTLVANRVLVGGGGPTATCVIYNRVTSAGVAIAHALCSDMLGQIRRRQRPA